MTTTDPTHRALSSGGSGLTVLDHVLLDHTYVASLLDRFTVGDVGVTAAQLRGLSDVVLGHEAITAALVRPRTREVPGGDVVVATLDAHAREVQRLLRVAASEVDDPAACRATLDLLRAAWDGITRVEEHVEHPRLVAALQHDELVALGRRYVEVTTRLVQVASPPLDAGSVRAAAGRAAR